MTMVPDDLEDAPDPGLARERTRLAWARTAIAFAAVGAAMLRRDPVAGLLALAVTPVIWALGRLASLPARPGPRPRQLLLVAVIVTLVAALAFVVALFRPGPVSLRQLLPLHG
ncbi:MAG: DUF202 domain-containing protein [Streptosporangiaceae bacterium]|nr:DUF202 domain-containing protein [Streptosporangiaceae bacterium]